MSPRSPSSPGSERRISKRDTSTRLNGSMGTCTRRPSVVATTATLRRSRVSNQPNVDSTLLSGRIPQRSGSLAGIASSSTTRQPSTRRPRACWWAEPAIRPPHGSSAGCWPASMVVLVARRPRVGSSDSGARFRIGSSVSSEYEMTRTGVSSRPGRDRGARVCGHPCYCCYLPPIENDPDDDEPT